MWTVVATSGWVRLEDDILAIEIGKLGTVPCMLDNPLQYLHFSGAHKSRVEGSDKESRNS